MKPAVIVVDMLKDAVRPFSLNIVPFINRLTGMARQRCIPVIFALDSFLPGDFIFQGKMGEHSIRGTSGAELMEQLERAEGDIFLPKRRFSAFFKTDLDQTLRLYRVDTVAIAGINTHWCVLNTAFDALANDFSAYVIEDCCASYNSEFNASIANIYKNNPLFPLFRFFSLEDFFGAYDRCENTRQPVSGGGSERKQPVGE